MGRSKDHWDREFGEGAYSHDPDPPAVLERYVDAFPDGRALDVATGTGRLSVFLASRGYEVDALDQSRVGLDVARERATEHDVEVNWLQADAGSFVYPEAAYDLITVRSYRVVDRLSDLKAALRPGAVLFVQDHLRTPEPMDSGPSDDRLRLAPNELLRACLDLAILRYEEFTTVKASGTSGTYAQLVAQKPDGHPMALPR